MWRGCSRPMPGSSTCALPHSSTWKHSWWHHRHAKNPPTARNLTKFHHWSVCGGGEGSGGIQHKNGSFWYCNICYSWLHPPPKTSHHSSCQTWGSTTLLEWIKPRCMQPIETQGADEQANPSNAHPGFQIHLALNPATAEHSCCFSLGRIWPPLCKWQSAPPQLSLE